MNTTRFDRAVWRLRAALFLLLGMLVAWPPQWFLRGDLLAVLVALSWSVFARPPRPLRFPAFEATVAAGILWLGMAPPHVAAAALLSFSVCHLALYGPRAASSVLALVTLASPLLIPVTSLVDGVALGSAMLLVLGTTAVAVFAFSRQRSVRTRMQLLARRAERMSFYLPDLLRPRLRNEPLPPCQLERVWLVVVFIDQVGFTSYSVSASMELIEQRVQGFVRDVRELARRHGGVVMKLLGDGALLAFQAEDEPDRRDACHRACALAMDALSDEPFTGMRDLRVGIASGECSVGDWGSEDLLDFTVIGPAVNLAARLQSSADIGGGLMCVHTAHWLGRLAEPRTLELRGFGRITAFAVC